MSLSVAKGQPSSAIYLQSENNLPYTVLWNGSKYTSSNTGNLLVSGVPAGNQSLSIAFSPEIADEHTFIISITDKARGFTLRQSVENDWTLIDMVDLSPVKGAVVTRAAQPEPVIPSFMLAEKRQPEKKSTDLPANSAGTQAEKAAQPISVKENIYKLMGIQKIFDKLSSAGIDQVYLITTGGKTDTVALFIPVLKEKEDQPKTTGMGQSAINHSNYAKPQSPDFILPPNTTVGLKPYHQISSK